MAENPLVVECPFWQLQREGFALKGKWHEEFFGNSNPIVLELGCGRGEYTVGLARRYPDKNFIGVDIKGSRMWHGAKEAHGEGMKNVAFLRTNIEIIHELFAADEVSEIWLTFSDPQMKKATKRLTSTYFMERYRKFLVDGGLIHVKTDSNFMATYTKHMVEHNALPTEYVTFDLYSDEAETFGIITQEEQDNLRSIQTYYEHMWLERGLDIKYLRFRLPHSATLSEPEIDIPVDDYRSYGHEVRTTAETRR